jgi:outer membrane protein assembly factor BamB
MLPNRACVGQRGLIVRRFVLFVAALAFVLVPWPATAAPTNNFPARIDLPDGFFPEGIESGRGTSVFVGSIVDGAIWRGDVRTGSGDVFAAGDQGRASIGIAYEASRNRLWVAGGGPSITGAGAGDVRVYDASSGELLRTFAIPAPADPNVRFLNDVAVTRDAVYVTDSFNPQLVVIPLPADGSLPGVNDATLLTVTGDFVQTTPGANLNGIVAKNGALVVAQSNTGKLFRVDPATGTAEGVDLGGTPPLSNADGLELRGHLLFVVRNNNVVTVVRLDSELTSGVVLGDITGELDTPSTATVAAGRLWVVNPRFNTPPSPSTEYWIAQLPLRPENG